MVMCKNCGCELPEGAKFCKECGSEIIEEELVPVNENTFCSNCGCELPEGAKFCKECGTAAPQKELVPVNETQFCSNCGYKIPKGIKFCPECGNSITGIPNSNSNVNPLMNNSNNNFNPMMNNEKNPILAAVLSFFIIGLGQMYLGLIKKGLILLLAAVICGILMLIIIGWVFWLIIWFYAIYDAYNSAEKINKGITVEDTIDFNNLF